MQKTTLNPSKTPLRIAIIGCGTMGQSHFNAYEKLGDAVAVVALCDLNEDNLLKAAQRWPQAHTTTDYRNLLESGNLDLVSICTMPDTHCEISIAALAAGAHVLCEKPFAMNLAQADQMLKMATTTNRHIQLGTNMRHMSDATILRNLVASGTVGKPVYIRAWTYYTEIPWWGLHTVKHISSGGALASTAIHILDLALWVAGSPDPLTVSGSTHKLFPHKRLATAPSTTASTSYDVEDIAAAHIRLSNNITLMLEGTWAHERPQSHYSFEMICERGTLTFDPLSVLLDEEGKIVDRTPQQADTTSHEENTWHASVDREIAHFVSAILSGTSPSQSPREIRNIQCIQDAIYTSAAQGREILLT